MSVYQLRDRTTFLIEQRVAEVTGELAERRDSLEEMRFQQGRIAGLKEAVVLQNEALGAL